ncbi:DegT/DnrJ/EryC1/StrS family aminotransferase [Dyadobacter linearis]|uniref:DegT/DnrJ/EryC1/StrS family aminotransferase n=1 Tax=Dyadobacter linearis TaxID=2823330 RepID=UPI00210674B5|nr:DegT/DnrJ/EryC1/StrS family aminotransferase [Dyadobacter sp. CECT 9623]
MKVSKALGLLVKASASPVSGALWLQFFKALICVHLYGMPCLMNELLAICDKYGIALIEEVLSLF